MTSRWVTEHHLGNSSITLGTVEGVVNSRALGPASSGGESQFLCLAGVWFWLIVWTLQSLSFLLCEVGLIQLPLSICEGLVPRPPLGYQNPRILRSLVSEGVEQCGQSALCLHGFLKRVWKICSPSGIGFICRHKPVGAVARLHLLCSTLWGLERIRVRPPEPSLARRSHRAGADRWGEKPCTCTQIVKQKTGPSWEIWSKVLGTGEVREREIDR